MPVRMRSPSPMPTSPCTTSSSRTANIGARADRSARARAAGQGWQIPKLDLHPRRISLKKVAMGRHPQVQLNFSNQGRGVLQGKIMVSEGQEWLRFAGGDGRQTSIKAPREQNVGLHIDTRSLVGGQKYTGRLTVITNGGIAEIPVRLDLAAVPFAQPPYKGAGTPRELAQRMLANPKPAVALLRERRRGPLVRRQRLELPCCRRPGRTVWRRCSSSSSAWAFPSRRR